MSDELKRFGNKIRGMISVMDYPKRDSDIDAALAEAYRLGEASLASKISEAVSVAEIGLRAGVNDLLAKSNQEWIRRVRRWIKYFKKHTLWDIGAWTADQHPADYLQAELDMLHEKPRQSDCSR